MNRADLARRLKSLTRAAPGAFRHDPVFRYAAIGAALALLMLVGRLGGRPGAAPPPAPPSAALGAAYGDRSGSDSSPSPLVPNQPGGRPVAPSRPLDGIVVRSDPNAPADRFGTLQAAQPHRKAADAHP